MYNVCLVDNDVLGHQKTYSECFKYRTSYLQCCRQAWVGSAVGSHSDAAAVLDDGLAAGVQVGIAVDGMVQAQLAGVEHEAAVLRVCGNRGEWE